MPSQPPPAKHTLRIPAKHLHQVFTLAVGASCAVDAQHVVTVPGEKHGEPETSEALERYGMTFKRVSADHVEMDPVVQPRDGRARPGAEVRPARRDQPGPGDGHHLTDEEWQRWLALRQQHVDLVHAHETLQAEHAALEVSQTEAAEKATVSAEFNDKLHAAATRLISLAPSKAADGTQAKPAAEDVSAALVALAAALHGDDHPVTVGIRDYFAGDVPDGAPVVEKTGETDGGAQG